MIEVYDDYVKKSVSDYIEKILLKSGTFPWNLNTRSMTYDRDEKTRNIFRKEPDLFVRSFNSEDREWICGLLNINPQQIFRLRANLVMPQGIELRHGPYHIDVTGQPPPGKKYVTAIYYVNDNSAPTVIKDGMIRKYIFPKKGRMVFFDNDHLHAQYFPPFDKRSVININLWQTL
tara:strand:+ start:308 stop:832 length:525 start_codon:yes stop_codon:yes gene_type:complete